VSKSNNHSYILSPTQTPDRCFVLVHERFASRSPCTQPRLAPKCGTTRRGKKRSHDRLEMRWLIDFAGDQGENGRSLRLMQEAPNRSLLAGVQDALRGVEEPTAADPLGGVFDHCAKRVVTSPTERDSE
jgi:hypothetical protein